MRRVLLPFIACAGLLAAAQGPPPNALDKVAAAWVEDTFKKMTLDDKVGQLVVSSFQSTYLANDSDAFEAMAQKIKQFRLGGFHVFGGAEPVPAALLADHYGAVTLGQPLEAASMFNRLQALSPVPLLNTADFESGVGFRIAGATAFPRLMAMAAAGDEILVFEAATHHRDRGAGARRACQFRAGGRRQQQPAQSGDQYAIVRRVARGRRPSWRGVRARSAAGGMLATLKHFPGHGDTDVDSHLGLPIIKQPRERLEGVELAPFREGIAAGADAVMIAHIQLPALDAAEFSPATLSRPIVTGLLRGELKFDGLIYTDSMGMDAIARGYSPGDAAVLAIRGRQRRRPPFAGRCGGSRGHQDGGGEGRVADRPGRCVSAPDPARQGAAGPVQDEARGAGRRAEAGRRTANAAIASRLSEKSITLLKDDRNQVPLRTPREGAVLYLSLLDYGSGWRIAAPGRTFIPELRKRWPNVTAIELSDRATASESISSAPPPPATTPSSPRSSSVRPPEAGGWISHRRWCGC